MRRPENPSLSASILVCLALAGCYGTSTDTENTLTATAYLADGRPAAGAVLAVRVPTVVVSPQGIPSWKSLVTSTADDQGRFFDVVLPQEGEIYLEVRQNPADTPVPGNPPQVYFIQYVADQARPDHPGTLTLSPSGSLTGRVELENDSLIPHHWIGVIGSSALVKLDAATGSASIPFQLDGLYPGRHALTFVNAGVAGAGIVSVNLKPVGEVKPDSVTDMGPIFYNGASWAP